MAIEEAQEAVDLNTSRRDGKQDCGGERDDHARRRRQGSSRGIRVWIDGALELF
jgi:hypothetical protein